MFPADNEPLNSLLRQLQPIPPPIFTMKLGGLLMSGSQVTLRPLKFQ